MWSTPQGETLAHIVGHGYTAADTVADMVAATGFGYMPIMRGTSQHKCGLKAGAADLTLTGGWQSGEHSHSLPLAVLLRHEGTILLPEVHTELSASKATVTRAKL